MNKFWANIIRYYTSKVHLRGLTKNQGFLTHEGGFCLCSSANYIRQAGYKLDQPQT